MDGKNVKITAETNILVRSCVRENVDLSPAARTL